MKPLAKMAILLLMATCLPELLSARNAKQLHDILKLHRANDSVANAYARIIGGTRSSKGAWPWQAALVTKDDDRFIFCGGSLIRRKWVLTAAHCVTDDNGNSNTNFMVRMGAYKRDNDGDKFQTYGQEFNVTSVIVHSQYDPTDMSHDVALVELDQQATLGSSVKTVALAGPLDAAHMRVGKVCVVTGFGAITEEGQLPDYMQEVRVNIAATAKCVALYQQLGIQIDNSMICAGKLRGKYDACQGDSGGPMVCKHDNPLKYYLHGVVSWGEGCGKAHQYGVYANVIPLLGWINQNAV